MGDLVDQFNTTDNVNTYGAHLLVDFRPIEEADDLLEECEQFISQSKTTLFTIPFVPAFSRVAAGVRNWRAKRRDTRLIAQYENLAPRVITTEKTLRRIIGEVVEKKAALRLQARYLQVRLEACIDHNRKLLAVSDAPLEELRSFVNKLSSESTILKDMILFNKEILRVKNIEKISKGQSFVRWGAKPAALKKAATEINLSSDPDHPIIETRLVELRELREKFVSCLAYILESRGTQMANLDNCERSLNAINNMIKRGGIADVPNGGKEEPKIAFDHSRCSDCSYAYSITLDCTNHLAALQKQAQEANQRLQSLVEMREKMSEASEQIAAESEALGIHSNSFSTIGGPGKQPQLTVVTKEKSGSGSFTETPSGTAATSSESIANDKQSATDDSPTKASAAEDGTTLSRENSAGTNMAADIAVTPSGKEGSSTRSKSPNSSGKSSKEVIPKFI